jgi:hypothetical protein
MANPNKTEGANDQDPLIRRPSPGEGIDSAEARQKSQEKYPGWETVHGKPHDPRFEGTADPNEDMRFDTHLRSVSVLPRKLSAAIVVWFLFAGIVTMVLLGFSMFWHFRWSAPRRPPQTEQAYVQLSGHDGLLQTVSEHGETGHIFAVLGPNEVR